MKKLLVFLAGAACGFSAWAATKGSCEASADSIGIGGSKRVTLTKEYDPEEKEYYEDSGAYYLKVTLSRNQEYTVWIEGGNADYIDFDCYSREPTEREYDAGIYGADASFSSAEEQKGNYVSWLTQDEWSSDDPSSWDYYIYLSGDPGMSCNVHISSGITVFLEEGISENPLRITMKDTETTASKKITEEGSYFFQADLVAGRKYYVRTTGGSAALPFGLNVDSAMVYESESDFRFASDTNNVALAVYPQESGTFRFEVFGGPEGTSFGFVYQSVPQRAIAKHPSTELADGSSADFRPGRVVSDLDYYDTIIDEELFRAVGAKKGERWVFDIDGFDRDVEMRIYGTDGAVRESRAVSSNAYPFITRLAWETTTDGLYVGVCDPALAPTDTVVCATTTIRAEKVPNGDGEIIPIAPLPGVSTNVQPLVDGAVYGPYAFDRSCWSKTFRIGARDGLTYVFATKYLDPKSANGLTLKAKAFYLDSYDREVETDLGSSDITPGALHNVAFIAKGNKTYYLRISVAEGNALDFPDFELYAMAYTDKEGEELGILRVDTFGAPGAQWYVDSEKSYPYLGGDSILVSGTHTVNFKDVSKFTTPQKRTDVAVLAGKTPTVVRGYYVDKDDPGDDYTSGKIPGKSSSYKPVAWSLKNTDTFYDHTLWKAEDPSVTFDPADNFSFAGTDGYFYDFALSGVTGDAVFSITNADPVLNALYGVSNVLAISKHPLPKGESNYILTVSHGSDDPVTGGCYRITGKYANVGAISFASTKVSAKEDAASVTLKLKRSASDGRVRVRYGTVAGTAKPGEDYLAQTGIIEWADKDKSEKAITIKLIPDLIPTYEGANKEFTVKIEPIPEDEREDDEYVATFTYDSKTQQIQDTATVTLTETAKKNPGTVQVDAEGVDPKKPVFTVTAGEEFTFDLARIVGSDTIAGVNGIVGVNVVSAKGTANKNGETDFYPINVTNVWADGEEGAWPVTVRTKPAADDYTVTKTFTLKLTALKTNTKKNPDGSLVDPTVYETPKFTATTITINIRNDKYAQSTPDWAKTKTFPAGITGVKEGKSGTWFCTDDGKNDLYATISRKFNGPARLRWWNDDKTVYGGETNELYVTSKGVTMMMRTEDVYTNDLLQAATPAAPTVDKAVVPAGPLTLSFDNLPDDEDRGIGYRVYVLSAGDKVLRPGAKSAVALKLGDPETEIQPEGGQYKTNVVYTTTNTGKYTWRVDSFYIGGTVTNTAKSAWSFTVLKPEETAAVLTVDGLEDGVTEDLDLGVPVEYPIHTYDDAKATVAVVSGTGSLPGSKLKLVRDTATKAWFLRGYADKAGDFQCAIQATSSSPAMKTPTYVLKFHVAALPQTKEIEPLVPCVNKAIVEPSEGQTVSFKAEDGVSYRAFFLEKGQKSAADPNKSLKLGDGETERQVSVKGGVASFESEMAIGTKTNYTWMVYAYYENGAVTNKSSTFSFDGAPLDGEGNSYATRIAGTDAYGKSFSNEGALDPAADNTMVLRQRLPASFEIENYNGKLKSVAFVSGVATLPTGLKLEQDKGTTKAPGSMKWFIRGTPTKVGDFQVLVQATYTNLVEQTDSQGNVKKDSKGNILYKVVETKGASTLLKFRVEAVEAVSDVSFTLAGPGRFVYDATDVRYPEEVGQRHTVTNWINSGSQTLKIADLKHLYEYKYVQLPVVTMLPHLVDKAVVANKSKAEFKFSEYDHSLTNEGVAFRVFALSDGASWTNVTYDSKGNPKYTPVKYKLGDAATEIRPNQKGEYITNVFYQAKINKGKWTFRVDSFFDDPLCTVTNAPKSAWSFTVSDKEAAYLPKTWVGGDDVTDVLGYTVNGSARGGQCGQGEYGKIYLRRLVKVDIPVGEEGSTVSKVTGNLPAGVSLKQVEVRKEGRTSIKRWFLTGTPTKAGEYPLVLQEKASNIPGTTTAFTLIVADADMAIGTFNGILAEDGTALTNAAPAMGTVQLTVSTAGKLSAKVVLAGSTYSFSGDGFDSVDSETDKMAAELSLVKAIAGTTYTNRLRVTVLDGCSTNLVHLGRVAGAARLLMAVPDSNNHGAQEGIVYGADLYRDNTKSKEYAAAFAAVSGYYTVALPILAPEEGKPQGNGYLTLTLDAKGTSKVAGLLADGTTVSCSLVPALIGDLMNPNACELFVPVFQYKSPAVFGGILRVAIANMADGTKMPVVDSTRSLRWANDNAALTYIGDSGWDYELAPSGGWYDKVFNLQTYYLNFDFMASAGSVDDLPEELLASGYKFVSETFPTGQDLDLSGNVLSAPKKSLVKDSADKSIYDFKSSVNPSGLTVSFTRATGIISGSFSVWTEGVNSSGKTVQKELTGFKHQGILLLSRDVFSPLAENVWTAGYFLAPSATISYMDGKTKKTRKYTESRPFNVISIDKGDVDHWEQDWGWNEDWGSAPVEE